MRVKVRIWFALLFGHAIARKDAIVLCGVGFSQCSSVGLARMFLPERWYDMCVSRIQRVVKKNGS